MRRGEETEMAEGGGCADREESHPMKMEAETGVRRPRAKERWASQKPERHGRTLLSHLCRGTLISNL